MTYKAVCTDASGWYDLLTEGEEYTLIPQVGGLVAVVGHGNNWSASRFIPLTGDGPQEEQQSNPSIPTEQVNTMSYQAICVDSYGCVDLLVGAEYTLLPDLRGDCADFVTVPGHNDFYHVSRFEAVKQPEATTPARPARQAPAAPDTGLAGTLAARGSRYGSFSTNGAIAQALKQTMHSAPRWCELTGAQAEALDMFASKISRILTGDPNYDDNWRDIAGYATLIEETLSN